MSKNFNDSWAAGVGAEYVSGAAKNTALLFGGGTTTAPLTTDQASKNFVGYWTKSTADTSRGMYWRHYIAGAADSGEAIRVFTTVTGAGAVGVHGIHTSLSLSGDGTITGQGAALRATLHVPNSAIAGTSAALYSELYADGSSSDVGGNTSFLRCVLAGNGTGLAAIEDDAALIRVEGGTNASGNVVGALNGNEPTWASHTGLIRVNLNGTVAYLVCITL